MNAAVTDGLRSTHVSCLSIVHCRATNITGWLRSSAQDLGSGHVPKNNDYRTLFTERDRTAVREVDGRILMVVGY